MKDNAQSIDLIFSKLLKILIKLMEQEKFIEEIHVNLKNLITTAISRTLSEKLKMIKII